MSDNFDVVKWYPKVEVHKFDDDQTAWVIEKSGIAVPQHQQFIDLGVKPYDVAYDEGNLLTTAGLTRLTAKLIESANAGTGDVVGLTNTSTRLGTGNGVGTASTSSADLSASAGAANRWYQVMDATFPSVAAAVLTAKATFATGDGNYAWNEWALDILNSGTAASGATVNNVLFNHKTSAALGTKTSGTWALTVTVTFA